MALRRNAAARRRWRPIRLSGNAVNVIRIKLSHDLPTRAQNELRHRIELGIWRAQWREAEAEKDYARLDRLHFEYERVGLP
jgi:hypothetical protein